MNAYNEREADMEARCGTEDDGARSLKGTKPSGAMAREKQQGRKIGSRHGGALHFMGVVDILREASSLLRSNSSVFMSIATILICPASALLLSHVLVDQTLANRTTRRLHDVARAAGLLETSFNRAVYLNLSQTLLFNTFCFPVSITLWLPAKAAIILTVICTNAGKKAPIRWFLPLVYKLWKRLLLTYVWVCLVLLGFTSVVVLFLLLGVILLDALESPASLLLIAEMALVFLYSVVFAHMTVVCNLATVVSVLEDYYGSAALLRSLFLIKGRTQVALLLFLLTTATMAMVEGLFEYRVMGVPGSSYEPDMASRLLEGPLLVFMYSFVCLLDSIMSCVFYFTCKSARLESYDKLSMVERVEMS